MKHFILVVSLLVSGMISAVEAKVSDHSYTTTVVQAHCKQTVENRFLCTVVLEYENDLFLIEKTFDVRLKPGDKLYVLEQTGQIVE